MRAGVAAHWAAATSASPSLGLRAFAIRNGSLDRFVGLADHSGPP
ncbi:unnamed protein product [Ciceribacter sp. T2.26MG-112.2]|nr:unnamed protein product [Ciceribacter naphthalenivorans]